MVYKNNSVLDVTQAARRGVENRCVRSGPDSYILGYWGGEHSDPRLLDECAIPTSRQNLPQIQYLNPLPVARAPLRFKGHLHLLARAQRRTARLLTGVFLLISPGGQNFRMRHQYAARVQTTCSSGRESWVSATL